MENSDPHQNEISSLTKKYNLLPHPEGGFYSQTFKSDLSVTAPFGPRSASTAIYFLITPGSVSRLHRLQADEVWHFYLGDPMTIIELKPDGSTCSTILGSDIINTNQVCQHVVRAGTWFGSYPNEGSHYSFVGCTVAPGFEFEDFEMGSRKKLVGEYGEVEEEIVRLTEGLPWI